METPKDIISYIVKSESGWDMADKYNMQFYNAVLTVDIGKFKAGDTINCIAIFLIDCTPCVQIFHDEEQYEYKIESVQFVFEKK